MRTWLGVIAAGFPTALVWVAAQGDPLQTVRWLGGCWEQRRGTRVTTEIWMVPDGGMALGASRTVIAGVTREYEQLRLVAREGKLDYIARPGSQGEATFTSTDVSDSGFTVENPAHDFPQRIIYRRRGVDSLVTRIEGPGANGPRSVDFPMRRIACEEK